MCYLKRLPDLKIKKDIKIKVLRPTYIIKSVQRLKCSAPPHIQGMSDIWVYTFYQTINGRQFNAMFIWYASNFNIVNPLSGSINMTVSDVIHKIKKKLDYVHFTSHQL